MREGYLQESELSGDFLGHLELFGEQLESLGAVVELIGSERGSERIIGGEGETLRSRRRLRRRRGGRSGE